ncbi:MAG: hypothetical protein LBB67_03085 [Oscillospiraceae bacterium]|nr:hypothetical protein [Oscillospiraceae bacterium]
MQKKKISKGNPEKKKKPISIERRDPKTNAAIADRSNVVRAKKTADDTKL